MIKVWQEITRSTLRGTNQPNPRFLDARSCEEEVLRPLARFADHTGPLVFEFPPMAPDARPAAPQFAARLDRFFARLSREFVYGVELRNRELLSPLYLDVLRKHGVAHVLNFWERMPSIKSQLSLAGVLTAEHVVARLLIPPAERYAERKLKLAPFDKIVDPQPALRDDIADLIERALASKKALFVIVNNKAEGSSPLTVRALIETWLSKRTPSERE